MCNFYCNGGYYTGGCNASTTSCAYTANTATATSCPYAVNTATTASCPYATANNCSCNHTGCGCGWGRQILCRDCNGVIHYHNGCGCTAGTATNGNATNGFGCITICGNATPYGRSGCARRSCFG